MTCDIKRILEALLFCSSEPLPLKKMQQILEPQIPLPAAAIEHTLQVLADEYREQNRAYRLERIGSGYLLRTCPEFDPYIQTLHKIPRVERLSQSAAEVLAIIAFKQPISRPQIDEIRGVDSSGVLATLCDRALIEARGKSETPGRATLWGTTHKFFTHFGLSEQDLRSVFEQANTP